MDVQSIGNAASATSAAQPTPARAEPRPVDVQRPPESGSSGEVRAVENQGTVVAPRGTTQQVEEAVQSVKDFVKPINSGIEFSVDTDTQRTVVKVIDVETKDVLRQIPSEEMLTIAKALDRLQGLLVRNKA